MRQPRKRKRPSRSHFEAAFASFRSRFRRHALFSPVRCRSAALLLSATAAAADTPSFIGIEGSFCFALVFFA